MGAAAGCAGRWLACHAVQGTEPKRHQCQDWRHTEHVEGCDGPEQNREARDAQPEAKSEPPASVRHVENPHRLTPSTVKLRLPHALGLGSKSPLGQGLAVAWRAFFRRFAEADRIYAVDGYNL